MGEAKRGGDCDVLVVGAGIAGSTAARALRAAGRHVLVLEKSRGLGGRAATRRWEGLPVDHGAQFFTARSAEFRGQVEDWLECGVCFEWSLGFHRATESGLKPPYGDSFPRYACREGMAALGRALAGPDDSFVLRECRVTDVGVDAARWQVRTGDGKTFASSALIMTPPAPQSAALLASSSPEAAAALSSICMAPCLALVTRYPRRELAWQGVQAPDDPTISWIGHDSSKRADLHPDSTLVVIHASPQFSEEFFERDENKIARLLLKGASAMTGTDLRKPSSFFLQRWRYALGAHDSEEHARFVGGEPPLVLAGDSIAGGKIEGAWLSGRAAARLLGAL